MNLIIKTDVHGTLDALLLSLQQIEIKDISINVLHAATGSITESDILLAKTADAKIIGFQVPLTSEAKKANESADIDIRNYNVIYDILNDLEAIMSGMQTKVSVETKIGEAEVREVFKFSKVGSIAGSMVSSGKLVRNHLIVVKRKGETLYKGKLTSLKRFKDDAKQVEKGYECGVVIDGFSDFESGDTIECFDVREE
jgi:translation initiation factor IF-2